MRGFRILVTLMAIMMLVPVHGNADMTAMQQSQNDEEQPDAENATLRIWSNGNQNHWSHLQFDDQNMKKICGTVKVAVPQWILNTMKPTLTSVEHDRWRRYCWKNQG